MDTVDVTARLYLNELACRLAEELDLEGLVDFVTDIDEVAADTAFTEKLAKRLVKVLKDEYGEDFRPSMVGL